MLYDKVRKMIIGVLIFFFLINFEIFGNEIVYGRVLGPYKQMVIGSIIMYLGFHGFFHCTLSKNPDDCHYIFSHDLVLYNGSGDHFLSRARHCSPSAKTQSENLG